MTQMMMPPALPGYPTQAAPPPPVPQAAPVPVAGGYPMPTPQAQPQGYPGPAVTAPVPQPQPVYAPAPAPQPHPAYTQPQPAAAPAWGGDIGSAIANATGGDRAPRLTQGAYLLEVLETIVTQHPQEKYFTFKARFKVLESNSPAFPQGSEGAYIEGVAYGAGRIQDFLIAASGYPSKALYDKTMSDAGHDPKVQLTLLSNAAGNPTAQQGGNHYPANPLGGRHVRTVVSEYDKLTGPRSKKGPGQPQHVINHVWSPAA